MNYLIIDITTAELQIPVSLYWGILQNFEIGMQFAGISRSDAKGVAKGVSDFLFGTKYTFLKETKDPLSPRPSISAEMGVSLPTGDYKRSFGTGGFGFVVFWMIEKEMLL
ncbi:MAG: transporter, partial [Endomicrobia bacterium]|nr:transporter [Endomicrobiia bacterium]